MGLSTFEINAYREELKMLSPRNTKWMKRVNLMDATQVCVEHTFMLKDRAAAIRKASTFR